MSQQNYPPRPQEEEIDLREQLELYLQRWPWFVLGIIVAVVAAVLYLKTATPTYTTVATVIIKDEEKGGISSELSAFADMGLMGGMGTSSIENELGIFRSKRLITNVARELQLNIRYFQEDGLRSKELFGNRPFNIQVLEFDERAYAKVLKEEDEIAPLIFNIQSDSTYSVEIEASGWRKQMNFGERLDLPYAAISVTPSLVEVDSEEEEEAVSTEVHFSTVEDAAAAYRDRVQVNLTDKNSSLIELSLEDAVKDKAQRILDQLVYQYNREAIEDKNLVSQNTANFIEERLQIITEELDSVETGKEAFKTENQLTNIEAESALFIENASDFRNRQLEVETQLELANTMLDYLTSDDGNKLLPANLGFKEEGVGEVINTYNQLVLERDRILEGSTERNPVIVNLNSQIDQIRGNVLQSLRNMRISLQIALKDLNEQEARIEGQIAAVPSKEKQFRNIERQQSIKEALYLYLLQKREETSLNLAVTAPKAKIVDSAYSSKQPVSPKSQIVLLAALILGLVVPFLFIYVKQLLSDKVQTTKDIENITNEITVVGEVPAMAKKDSHLIMENDRSILAESFRILHTNLQYMFINSESDEKRGKAILTTSTVKGEGKTFVSMNLAITIANTGKRVVLVGADIRNPQLQRYLPNADRSAGVTEYLVNKNLKIEELIQKTDIHPNLDILLSGSIPPNPAELWRQGRTEHLFEELRARYEYVIIDSAPSLLVTDTFLINQYADSILYVARAGVTKKKMVDFPVDSLRNKKLHDVGFVLNDVEISNFGYGNKYGYAYGDEQLSLWERIRNRAAFW